MCVRSSQDSLYIDRIHFGGFVGYSSSRIRSTSTQPWHYRSELTIGEQDIELEQPTFPKRLIFARHPTFPFLEIQNTIGGTNRFCEEAKWVVTTPLLSDFRKASAFVAFWTSMCEIERLTSPLGGGSDTATSSTSSNEIGEKRRGLEVLLNRFKVRSRSYGGDKRSGIRSEYL